MTSNDVPLHVYRREISTSEQTSLSVIAGLIQPGCSVLDLGTGSGALGRHLREQQACVVDGVTLNDAEAELARPHYRRIEVADLEQAPLTELFQGAAYDCIVCADVLEHLKQPEQVLSACRELLAPTGKVLISVPNAGYCGLIAELLEGEFEYRPEGLLDSTHLRFFTRRSLGRFLASEGWSMVSLLPVLRELGASEFRTRFDSLPPAVGRYLLAVPDALAYQFVAEVRPATSASLAVPVDSEPTQPAAQALFTAELFLGQSGAYSQQHKQVVAGVIGRSRQTLRFAWGDDVPAWTSIKLDPADRPGFIHLYRISLMSSNGECVWEWRCERDSVSSLEASASQQLLLRPPWPEGAPALALLHGDDPWIELPIAPAALAAMGSRHGGALEVEVGWPMSADYLALKDVVKTVDDRLKSVQKHLDQQVEERDHLAREVVSLAQVESRLSAQRDELLKQKGLLVDEQTELRNQHFKLRDDYAELAAHLQDIERSRLFRMTRPLSHLKGWVDRNLRGRPGRPNAVVQATALVSTPVTPTPCPVDVIVPVYRGLADTQLCLESVLASRNDSAFRLIVINDASPEPELAGWLRELRDRDQRVVLVENEQNLGFVGTVNRGMAMSDAHDVILLNSDTEVANDWLDRLKRAAYSDARVGTVTPFSNNATICSYPRFCESNTLPAGLSTAALDALFARTLAGQTIDVPTGNGFCMYVRRDCLAQVGLFDVEQFGKGYGEENDFCQRAQEAGWRNLHALDTFVLHSGGVSFGASKGAREIAAMETLRRLHPAYEQQVHRFIALDPALPARQAIDLARVSAAGKPVVLLVMHDREGGTLRHMQELAAWAVRDAVFFVLRPASGPSVQLDLLGASEGFRLSFQLPSEFTPLVDALRGLGVGHVHFHHLLGHTPDVLALPAHLGVRYDFTAHDYHAFCPQISLTGSDNSYCGEEGPDQCRRCLSRSPAPGGVSIEQWRVTHGSLIAGARHVLVPSHDAAQRFLRYAPSADVRYAPHDELLEPVPHPVPVPRQLATGAPLKVVVIGALSPIKGADLLEDVATLAAQTSARIDFHLLGFAYRNLRTRPRASLTVHGQYEDADLARLLDWLQPDLVWFPALWPETYSYTLSACLEQGLPVVAPDLGAFAERLSGRAWSWIRPWKAAPSDWLAFFNEVRERHFATGQSPAPTHRLQSLAQDPRVRPWSYARDYLSAVPAPGHPAALSPEFLARFGSNRAHGVSALRQGFKQSLLMAILRLRAMPMLRSVARAIPLRWQTRVKSWLRA